MSESTHQLVDEHSARILIVDDNDQVRRLTRLMLALEGYEVMEAENGRDAMQLFAGSPSDVVITDLFMPEEDGLELIGQLRKYRPKVPIIAISGGGNARDTSSLRAAALLGADEVLEKPFSPDDLAAAIRRVLKTGK
jgi:CheY-like chemotaxis protein